MLTKLLSLLAGARSESAAPRGITADQFATLSPRAASEAASAGDIIEGVEFYATHELRTPLRILRCHGRKHHDMQKPPPRIADEEWQGVWLPVTNTWRSMAIDLPEMPERYVSSDAGAVMSSEYLPFLLAVRQIVEGSASAALRREWLEDEIYRRPQWSSFVRALGGHQAVLNRFFPPFVETIKGLSPDTLKQLRAKRLTSPASLTSATDAELLSVKGVGSVKLAVIRGACATVLERHTAFADLVKR